MYCSIAGCHVHNLEHGTYVGLNRSNWQIERFNDDRIVSGNLAKLTSG